MRFPAATQTLVDAYRAALYEVDLHGQLLVIRVDEPLRAALDAHLHGELLSALSKLGVSWLRANSRDPSGQWPSEPSVLALGIDTVQAMQVAEQFEQNAYIEVQRGEPACLILTAHWDTRC
jgi:hypothetical protein